jgi:hypothetical protein
MTRSAKRAVDTSRKRKKKKKLLALPRFRLAPPLFDAGSMQKGVVEADAIAGNNNAINNKTGIGGLGRPTATIMSGTYGHPIKPWQ